MSKLLFYAKFCSIFAIFGIVFLVIIGIMLQKQPIYMKGIEDPSSAASSCYNGALIYFVIWIVSLVYWSRSSASNQDEEIPVRGYGSIEMQTRAS